MTADRALGWRFDHFENHGIAAIDAGAATTIAAESLVLSDGWPGFTQLSSLVQCHEPRITGHGPKAAKHPEFHWVNTLLSNLKTMLPQLMHAAVASTPQPLREILLPEPAR